MSFATQNMDVPINKELDLMVLKEEAGGVLQQLKQTINLLSDDVYTQKIDLLSNSSIGEHTRHVIELFQQLILGYETDEINYDQRKRDLRLQENIDFASKAIDQIISNLEKHNKPLSLTSVYNHQESKIESNFAREIMYNIEHCIHHQAIIKIALLILKINVTDEHFGVAKSTIEYRKQCAQ